MPARWLAAKLVLFAGVIACGLGIRHDIAAVARTRTGAVAIWPLRLSSPEAVNSDSSEKRRLDAAPAFWPDFLEARGAALRQAVDGLAVAGQWSR